MPLDIALLVEDTEKVIDGLDTVRKSAHHAVLLQDMLRPGSSVSSFREALMEFVTYLQEHEEDLSALS
jgi:hypothetical protein